jgi:hypothetical protein
VCLKIYVKKYVVNIPPPIITEKGVEDDLSGFHLQFLFNYAKKS